MLNKKSKRSKEKEVEIINIDENGNPKSQTKTFKKYEDFKNFILSLNNPYIYEKKEIGQLSQKKLNFLFLENDNIKVYEMEKSENYLDKYKIFLKDLIECESDSFKIEYPYPIIHICFDMNYFFNTNISTYPAFFGIDNRGAHLSLNCLFLDSDIYLMRLFHRPKSGITMLIFKIINNTRENIIYLDMRKLREILSNFEISKFKKFIIYSLFWFIPYISNIERDYNNIKLYSNIILLNIIQKYKTINIENCIQTYVEFLKSREGKYYLILDHFNNDIEQNKIDTFISNTLSILLVQQLNTTSDIDLFFSYIEKYDRFFSEKQKGAEFCDKDEHNYCVYYEEAYPLNTYIFKQFDVLLLYKEELLQNFNYNTHIYFYKFLQFMNDKEQKVKKIELFNSFIKDLKLIIKKNILKFYNNQITDEIYFISKYYNHFLNAKKFEDNPNIEAIIEILKKNLPQEYFILFFEKKEHSKKIIKIEPCCNLIKNIVSEISQNFSSLIYQSHYYAKAVPGEKGYIFENTIVDILQANPKSFFCNDISIDINIDYIIPSKEKNKKDPIEEFFINNNNVENYLKSNEIRDMKNLRKLFEENKNINNIFIFQNDSKGKNYDFGIIKFLQNNKFILILSQVTIRTDNDKFKNINLVFHKDLFYINSKIEKYFPEYKSIGTHLIYILPKEENDNKLINYNNSIDKALINNVHLFFFDKNLCFYTDDNKMIKNITFDNNNNFQIEYFDNNNSNIFYGVD